MKIIEHGPDQMEIRSRIWIFLLLFGFFFLSTGLIIFFTIGQTSELTCIRSASGSPQCQLTRTLLGKEMSAEPIKSILGAYVDSATDSDGDTTYRVILQTTEGEVPLTKSRSSGRSSKQNTVAQIENFINNPNDAELSVANSGTMGVSMGSIFAVIGILTIFSATQTMFNAWYFDRPSMTVTHHKESIFGNRNLEWGLNEFTEASVAGNRDSDGDRTYRIELITSMNEHIPMTSWWSSGYRRKAEVAEKINQFLKG